MGLAAVVSRMLGIPTAPTGTYLRGVDVSRHQGVINWDLVLLSGIQFAFVKATEGSTWKDPMFDTNWAALKSLGAVRGAYHYYRPIYSLTEQVENFYAAAQDTQLPPVLDVEVWDGNAQDLAYYRNTPKAIVREQLRTMLNLIEARFGRKPIIYTARWFWDQYIGIAGWEEEYPLWFNYVAGAPRLPSAWSAWSFWQYSITGSVPGIPGDVDLNYFSGSLSDLQELCWNEPTLPPVSIGRAVVLGDGLRVRRTPWGTITGRLNAGDIVDVFEIAQLDTWARIGDAQYVCVQNNGTPYLEWVDDDPETDFDSPVGTELERASDKIYPGNWFSAQGIGGGHTGDDLNNNIPWDADAHAPVYAIADGVVTYAGIVPAPSTWGGVIVIQHGDVWARYAHVENIQVSVGQEVVKGQQIAQVGQYLGTPPNYHLHFDIADSILASDPLNWPGYNPDFIAAHYKDPAPFIRAHRGAA